VLASEVSANGHSELFKKYERDRRQLIEKYNEEITQLKMKILELQSQPQTVEYRGWAKGQLSPESIYH
jgi:hypothetical protein